MKRQLETKYPHSNIMPDNVGQAGQLNFLYIKITHHQILQIQRQKIIDLKMNYLNHPQYQFLISAGMSPTEAAEYLAKDLGLRNRPYKQRHKAKLESPKGETHRAEKFEKNIKRQMPQSLPQFEKEFKEFIKASIRGKTIQGSQKHPLPILFRLLTKVHEWKGIVEVMSHGQWKKMVKELREIYPEFQNYSQKELLDLYLRYLIEYEFYIAGEPLKIEDSVEIEKHYRQAVFVSGKLCQLIKDQKQGLALLTEDVVVFVGGTQQLGIRYQNISLAKIEESCGDEMIDIRIQHPLDYGFNINKLTNTPFKMSIKEYCQYQKNFKIEAFKRDKFGDQLKNGKIFFGVNFEPGDSSVFDQIWKRIDGGFLGFKQKFDLLSYLDDEVLGCSTPQFYLKVNGCWTGGHQENVNMSAVNINHGPDPSQWLTIPFTEVEKLRKVLLQRFKCDLYKDEGLWFQRINWFIENGFSIKRIIQRKGDIVVTGPGTLHWVRSHGVALHSAWNLFPKTHLNFQRALYRHQQNSALKLQKKNVIPLKSLLLKYVDHELFEIEEKSLKLIITSLQNWSNQEQRLRLELEDACQGFKNPTEYHLSDLQSICALCRQEVFNYFVQSWSGVGIACLQCLADNPNLHGILSSNLYFKLNNFNLKNLFTVAEDRNKGRKRWTPGKLCQSAHIGNVVCRMQILNNRKRAGQPYESRDTDPMSENEQTDPNKLQALIQKYQNPLIQTQTITQNLLKINQKNNELKTTEAQVQTDETYQYCRGEVHFCPIKPSKRFKHNDHTQEEEQQTNHRQDERKQRHRRSEEGNEQKESNRNQSKHRDSHHHSTRHHDESKSRGDKHSDRHRHRESESDRRENRRNEDEHSKRRDNDRHRESESKVSPSRQGDSRRDNHNRSYNNQRSNDSQRRNENDSRRNQEERRPKEPENAIKNSEIIDY